MRKCPKCLKAGNLFIIVNWRGRTREVFGLEIDIIKIVEVKPRTRITLPKPVQDYLNVKEGDHIAFLREQPGVRIVKVILDLNSKEVK